MELQDNNYELMSHKVLKCNNRKLCTEFHCCPPRVFGETTVQLNITYFSCQDHEPVLIFSIPFSKLAHSPQEEAVHQISLRSIQWILFEKP